MAPDQSQLEAALSAVEDPELGLTLGDLGLVRSVRDAPAPGARGGGPPRGGLARHRRAGRGDPPGGDGRARRRGGRARLRGDERRGAHRAAAPAARRNARKCRHRWRRRSRSRPRRARACPGRADAGLPRPRRLHARDRDLLREGRRRQVDGDGEPGHRLGPGRSQRRAPRRRRLRLLRPQDARDRPRPGHHRRHRHPDVGARRQVPVDGLLRARRPAGHLAGADAAQGDSAIPHRRLLGRARLRAHRHAPGHR